MGNGPADPVRELSALPIWVAPMAGGPSTTGLVAAAARAGAVGFLAGGYKTAAAIRAEMDTLRAAGTRSFGVNVFVPGAQAADAAAAVSAYVGSLRLSGGEPGQPEWDDDGWADKIELLLADPRFTATAVTRAFSGRPARALVNRFLLDHPDAPAGYPEINNATRPLRARAAAAGDADGMSLYAGEGFRAAADRPAAEIVRQLAALLP